MAVRAAAGLGPEMPRASQAGAFVILFPGVQSEEARGGLVETEQRSAGGIAPSSVSHLHKPA
jgi:hypothetical protein